MAEDTGGGGGGTELAAAFVSIGADMNPLQAAVGRLPSMLTAPLTNVSGFVRDFLGTTLEGSLTHALSGNFGAAVENMLKGSTHSLAAGLRGALTLVLGETIGGGIGGALEGVITGIGDRVAGLVGKTIGAATFPIRRALDVPLGNWDLWAERAITAETAMVRFNATLSATGGVAGFSAEQLGYMAEKMSYIGGGSQFSVKEIRAAEQALLSFDRIRGQAYRGALDLAVQLAALKGMSPEEAVHGIGMALSDPEHAGRRLHRMGVFLGPQDEEAIKQIQETNGTLDAQMKLLDLLRAKWSGAGAAMAGTTESTLAATRNMLEGVGLNTGRVILPAAHLLADVARSVVEVFAGGVNPVLKDMAGTVEGWVGRVRGWLAENRSTFVAWGESAKAIISNVYGLAKEGLSSLFGQMNAGGARDFWASFSAGVSGALDWVKKITASWDNLKAGGEYAFVYIRNRFMEFVDKATSGDTWKSLWQTLKDGFASVASWIVDVLGKASDFVGERLASAISNAITNTGTIKFLGQVFDAATMNLFTTSAEEKKRSAEEAARKVRDALGAVPNLPGGGDNAAAAQRAKEEQEAKERFGRGMAAAGGPDGMFGWFVRGTEMARQAAQGLARDAELAAVRGVQLEEQVKDHVQSIGIKDVYSRLQSSIRPEAHNKDARDAQNARHIAEVADATKKQLEKLDKIADGLGRINLGFV